MAESTRHAGSREARKLIEYRTAYYSPAAEFSIYETNQTTRVELGFSNPIICAMATGKKHMTLPGAPIFTFLPGESMVVPPDMLMTIDFPEADPNNPVKCYCIEVEHEKIDTIVRKLNESRTRSPDSGEWRFNKTTFSHFTNEPEIEQAIGRLMSTFSSSATEYRDTLIDLGIAELVVRVLQSNARELLIERSAKSAASHGLAAAVQYIKDNPYEKVYLNRISAIAGMSPASLYRYFKIELGMSPSQYIAQVKIRKAYDLLQDPRRSATDVCYDLGFSSVSSFIKRFRQLTGVTPKQFQKDALESRMRRRAAVR